MHAARIWGQRGPIGPESPAGYALGFQHAPPGLLPEDDRQFIGKRHAPELGLDDPSPLVRRAAVEALGAHPPASAFKDLLSELRFAPRDDDHLIHACRIALRDLFLNDAAWNVSETSKIGSPEKRRVYYVNINGGPEDVALVAEIMLALPSDRAAENLVTYLGSNPVRTNRHDAMYHHIARYADDRDDRLTTMARVIRRNQPSRSEAAGYLKALNQGAQERNQSLPPEVRTLATEVATDLLTATDPGTVRQGIDLAGALDLTDFAPRLGRIAVDRDQPVATRSPALAATARLDPGGAVAALTVGSTTPPNRSRSATWPRSSWPLPTATMPGSS